MWSLLFVAILIAIILLAKRLGFFEAHRDQQTPIMAGIVAVGAFGTYIIDRISAGYSPYASVVGALVVSAVATMLVVVLVRLRGKSSA
jgi:hypothetical protein